MNVCKDAGSGLLTDEVLEGLLVGDTTGLGKELLVGETVGLGNPLG